MKLFKNLFKGNFQSKNGTMALKKKKKEDKKAVEQEANVENVATEEQAAEETTEEIDSIEEELLTLKEKNAELQDKYLRLFAEFENFRKRSVKEKVETMNMAAKETILALLPIVDDFDRAKNAANQSGDASFDEGVGLIHKKMVDILSKQGLKAMETNGETFDAELHEAITEIPAPTDEMKGKIIDTVETGYFLKDKIIRFPKVVVGK